MTPFNREPIQNYLGQTYSTTVIVLLSQVFLILLMIFYAFGEFIFQQLVASQLFQWDFPLVQQDTFHAHQEYEDVNCTKNQVFFDRLKHRRREYLNESRDIFAIGWKTLLLNQILKNFTFLSILSNLLWCYAKKLKIKGLFNVWTLKLSVCPKKVPKNCHFWRVL